MSVFVPALSIARIEISVKGCSSLPHDAAALERGELIPVKVFKD